MAKDKKFDWSDIIDYFTKVQNGTKDLDPDNLLNAIKKMAGAHEYTVNQQKKEKELEKQREIEAQENKLKQSCSMELPLDYANAFSNDNRIEGIHTDSVADALVLSLQNIGSVDIEYIASITGENHKNIINSLKGSIFQNPEKWNECFYKGWETADEYLTGNLKYKLKIAREANQKYNGYFENNIRALLKVLPKAVSYDDIFITLGSPWVPVDVIESFIEYLLGRRGNKVPHTVRHNALTGTWEIINKNYGLDYTKSNSTYGTFRNPAIYIIEKSLNMKTVSVFDEVPSATSKSGKKRVLNKNETAVTLEKQKMIIEEFQRWVWKDEERKKRLEGIFDEQYASYRRRHFDGSFLQFAGLNENVSLYPYQKDAVARILFSPNTLLAHDVGSGKTYVMIAAGMELRRMGLSKKNLYVVPNNIVGQWKDIFFSMYPQAKVKVVEPKSFTPSKRKDVLEDIVNNDYDGIIMAYSCFEMIPLSKEELRRQLIEKRETFERDSRKGIDNPNENKKSAMTSGLIKEVSKIDKLLQALEVDLVLAKYPVTFDKLGITRLFVDEAHNFKNVPIETKIGNVLGISSSGSAKCKEMLDKIRYVQGHNNGGGVVLATGTPITNSLTDAYVMQMYLQSGELALLDIQNFDAWIGMFAEKNTEFEVDVDTSGFRLATRFSRFHNLPELTSLLSSIADFHHVDKSAELPDFNGYKDALVAKTPDFDNYLKEITKRADAVRNGQVPRTEDNMLKITTDGRKAALDVRLVNPQVRFNMQSKVQRCAENIADLYFKTEENKLTQLVFCDTSTPKDTFNIYDDLFVRLISFGVDTKHIAYVHDADTEEKRNKLFEEMRNGTIRVLIGSTFKLGLGVNVQDKLVAVHHLDVPWRPADMVQREGRIIRPGNTNREIFIFRYITEGSFDAYSWQLLETKQNFISALLSGALEERDGNDVDDAVLNYAEVKALAIGNPLIKERVEVANELSRLRLLQNKTVENRISLQQEMLALPTEIEEQKDRVNKCRSDAKFYAEEKARRRSISALKEDDGQKTQKGVNTELQEKKRKFREYVFNEVCKNAMQHEERRIISFCGFDIILPANMLKEKPYVYLQRQGRYYVEIGDSSLGVIKRLFNCLEDLDGRLERLDGKLSELLLKKESIRQALLSGDSYADEIEKAKERLETIDKKLGVK